MEWPSKRIPVGGMLQPARVQYSAETHQLLKELMQESRLTMLQRQRVNYHLRNGEPLPDLSRSRSETRARGTLACRLPPCSRPSKRRSQSTIQESGAYSRDQFVRTVPLRDREVDKQRLQTFMEYGKNQVAAQLRTKVAPSPQPAATASDRFPTRYEELKSEIDERLEWLADMETLGQAKPHRLMIQQQVALRLREMENLKVVES